MSDRYPFGTPDYQRAAINVGGNVYFVNANAVAGRSSGRNAVSAGRTPEVPFASIAYAVTQCVAGRGDRIYALPGHTESVSSATTLALSVAGITVEGLGYGLNRPIITLNTATTATIPVSAANITLKNLVFSANFADIVSLFTLAACRDFRVEGCTIRATATDMNFLHVFDTNTTDNAQDGLTFVDNEWFEPDAATLAFGLVDAAIDRLNISRNLLVTGAATADVAALLTIATGKNLTNVRITNNDLDITGNAGSVAGLFITTDGTAGTGIIARNNLKHLDATTELFITATHTWGLFDNRSTAVANAQGYLLPAIDS